MGDATPRARTRPETTADGRGTTWVVSPHLLVAQAVTAALRSVGADADFRAWDGLVEEAAARAEEGRTRHVVAIFDGLDDPVVVEEVGRLVALGDVRVAVVTSDPFAFWWGGLVADGAVDVVTTATSIDQLADVVDRLSSGSTLMETGERAELHARWTEALDRRQDLVALMRTLSPQQLRVLELLASGSRVREAAEVMGVADGTVRSHVKSLRSKLGARTQLEAVAMLRQVQESGVAADMVPRPRT
ncbi:LuxR C-terminal-related transcriptional regulator [Nocardioides sp.]|uniref:response regulator transcription factor n=1 Tax=Nocardioides sp. TaxID=35761 RepID=UPI002628739E|nr:LuxR C-terminal-related transcriptional regulator [Nocardioides sp.]MCW2739234.1 DNA-binding response regulator [Nocardioides sp.]